MIIFLTFFGFTAVQAQFLSPLSTYSQPFCGRFPYQNASDLCCNGYHYPNLQLPMHTACCQSSFYDTRQFGCDGSKTFLLNGASGGLFPFNQMRHRVVDRVLPTNYYCGKSMYDPNTQYCCGCCGDGDRKIVNNTDKYSLCCNGRWVVNPERVLACCGINAYDTRFYMCTPPLEVVPRKPPLQPFVPTDFCEGRGYNPETDYCCGSSVLPKNSSQSLCCNGNFFTVPDKTSYACCCDSFYNTASQMCDKDCTVRPIDKGGPKPLDYCGERIYNPLEDSCCGNVFIANNSIGHYLCCDNVYYANAHPNLACCGKNVYDIHNYRCQDYHIIPLNPATVTFVNNIKLPRYCGGAVPYDSNDALEGLCCRGLYYPNSEGNGHCCGSALFVPGVHTCHGGVVFFNGAPLPQPSLVYLPPTVNFQSQANQYLKKQSDKPRNDNANKALWPSFEADPTRFQRFPSAKARQHNQHDDTLPPYAYIQSHVPSQTGNASPLHIVEPRYQHEKRSQQPEREFLVPRQRPPTTYLHDPLPTRIGQVPFGSPSMWPSLFQQSHPSEDPNANVFQQKRINFYNGPTAPSGPVSRLPNGQMAVLADVQQLSQARRTNVSLSKPFHAVPGAVVRMPPGVETQPATYRFQYLQPRDAPMFNGQPSEPPVEKARPLPASPFGYEYSLLCNGQPFDSQIHFCCGGQLIRIRPDPYQLCCGDIYYDNVNKDPSLVCCGRRVCRWNRQFDNNWRQSAPFS